MHRPLSELMALAWFGGRRGRDKSERESKEKRYDVLTLTWKVLSVEEGGVSGEWWICRVIIGVEDGLLEDGALVSLASLSHTEPGDQISLFRLMLDETSLGFVLRFNGTSSSETRRRPSISSLLRSANTVRSPLFFFFLYGLFVRTT